LIGNVFKEKIAGIYDSPAAQKYRSGCRACDGCNIRHACGGCMAISHSLGQDIYSEKDPYCFMNLPA
jgi:radical SAM protein with 4Fe4S-binding SPASM domain